MKNILSKFKNTHKSNKSVIIGGMLIVAIIFSVIVVSSLFAYQGAEITEKVDVIGKYYDDAFKRAFTKEQRNFLVKIGYEIDLMSEDKDKEYSEDQLNSPLNYGKEFESITSTYRDIMHESNSYSDSNTHISNNREKLSDSKDIPALIDEIREEYYSLLESKNIDTTMLKENRALQVDELESLENSTLKEYISNLKDVEDVKKTTVGLTSPYITTYNNEAVLAFPKNITDSLQKTLDALKSSGNIEDNAELDKIYLVKPGSGDSKWTIQLLVNDYTKDHEYNYDKYIAFLVSEFNSTFEKLAGDFNMVGDVYINMYSSVDESYISSILYNPESRSFQKN